MLIKNVGITGIVNWFKEAIPSPTDKNRAVQIGVHFEEVGEMATAIGERGAADLCNRVALGYKQNSEVELHEPGVDRKELLDSLCDQIVTAVGVAHMFDLDIVGALTEVNRSNWSKFVDGKPQFDANGKIAKPATYSPPDLTPFI